MLAAMKPVSAKAARAIRLVVATVIVSAVCAMWVDFVHDLHSRTGDLVTVFAAIFIFRTFVTIAAGFAVWSLLKAAARGEWRPLPFTPHEFRISAGQNEVEDGVLPDQSPEPRDMV
jgi:chromate transport protein ChrA